MCTMHYALPGSCSSTSVACKPLTVSNKHRHEAREHPAQHPGLKRGSCARRRMLQMLQSLLLLHVYSETGRNGCSRGNFRPRHCLGGDHQPQQRTATTQRWQCSSTVRTRSNAGRNRQAKRAVPKTKGCAEMLHTPFLQGSVHTPLGQNRLQPNIRAHTHAPYDTDRSSCVCPAK